MKKYISLISALTLGTTATLTVVACGETSSNETDSNPIPGIENIKQWSNQTSNIAKSLILSKNENFNTNRLVNNALNNTANNILKNTNNNTGTSYQTFKSAWGYQGNIQGITEADFNNDSAQTSDNNQIASKQSIIETIKDITTQFNLISIIPPSTFQDNKSLSTLLNTSLVKDKLLDPLFGLKGNQEIVNTIKSIAPLVQSLATNLGGFDAKATLGDYYDEDISTALFEKNNGGWLKNYKTFGGFTSEAVEQKSTILNDKNIFKNWDEVALFKTSIDLNGLIYSLSNQKLTLGQIFNNSISYNQKGIAEKFDINKFVQQFQTFWESNPESIGSLITTLIPVIKTQLLGIKPSTAITKISTQEETQKEKGIINLADLITTIEDNFLSKAGFTKFLSNIFFSETSKELKLGNYITLDFTLNNKTLSEIISPIKDDINNNLGNLYTTIFTPVIEKYGIKNILTKIKEILKSEANTEINLSDVQGLAKILNNQGLYDFLNKLTTYESKDELSKDWANLWANLGLQDPSEANFKDNSVFAQFSELLTTNPKFLTNLSNMLKLATPIIENSFDIIIAAETTAKLDFNNQSLWAIEQSSVVFTYNAKLDETTISYNLIDKTQSKSKTYNVTVVIKGNADTPLTDTKQVWLKALKTAK